MEKSFGWQGYWACFALTAAYYITIYLLFLRKSISTSVSRKLKAGATAQSNSTLDESIMVKPSAKNVTKQTFLFEDTTDFSAPAVDSIEYIVYGCMDELNAVFEQCKHCKCVREGIIISLQKILRKYPSIRSSEYKDSLMNVIRVQCENVCSIRLSAEDMVRVLFG